MRKIRRNRQTFQTTQWFELTLGANKDSREVGLEVEFTCSAFVPAQTSGPPEDCYPAEGGEVEDVQPIGLVDRNGKALKGPQWLEDWLMEHLDQDALGQYADANWDDGDQE